MPSACGTVQCVGSFPHSNIFCRGFGQSGDFLSWCVRDKLPVSKLTTSSSISLPRPIKLPTSPTSPNEVVKLQLATPSSYTDNWDTSSVSLPRRPSKLPTSPTSPIEVVKLQLATPSFQTDNWADSSLPTLSTKSAKVAIGRRAFMAY